MVESIEYIYRQLNQDDQVRKLSHGDPQYLPLRVYLENNAKNHHLKNLSKTYVCITPPNRVVAYITILCSQVELIGEGVPEDAKNFHFPYPAVKIAKLCVRNDLRGSGIGKNLVNIAIATAKENVSKNVGCRFVVVDSHKNAVSFYKGCGFILVNSPDNLIKQDPVMFLDIGKLD
jgi:predicted GNAT family N-acyltransferase